MSKSSRVRGDIMNSIKLGFNLNQKVCTSIIERFANQYSLETVSRRGLKPYAILELDNQSYIIAERNEKLANILIDYYQKGKQYHLIIPITCYLMIQALSFTTQIDTNAVISYLNLKDPYAIEVSADDNKTTANIYEARDLETEESLLEYTQKMNAIYESRREDRTIEAYNTYLAQYSDYFHLDSEKVIDIAKQLTDNYHESFMNTLSEKAMEEYNLYDVIDHPEADSLLFNYFVYRNVIGNEGELAFEISDFGYSKSDLVTTHEIETIDYTEDGEQVLANGFTRSQFTGKICDLLKMDKNYTLAISYSETGVDGSPASRDHNNYGGMKNKDGELMEFPTAYAGLVSQALNLKTYPSRYGVDSLEKLWEVHAEKGEDWLPNVNHFYNLITSDPSSYFIGTSIPSNYQDTLPNAEDSFAWNHDDLSYSVDPTLACNVNEEAAVLMKKM